MNQSMHRNAHQRPALRARGFTLIELMITVAIITIIASIAIPSYRQHVIRTHRGDATQALLRIAAEQEKFYLQNNTFADSLGADGLNVPVLSENGYYALSILNGDVNGFTASAEPVAGNPSPQRDDDDCQEFQINERGQRLAFDKDASPNNAVCWR